MATEGIGTDRPASPLDREAVAQIEVGQTNVSHGVAGALVGWFLLMLVLLPLAEIVAQRRAVRAGSVPAGAEAPPLPGAETPPPQGAAPVTSAWSYLARVPHAIDERLATLRAASPTPGAWRELITANRAVLEGLSGFETALEDQSAVGRALRPPTQLVLSGWLGAGNERVYVGREGWLFYRPDVEYVTGGGFLDQREMDQRVAAATEYESRPQPDPRPAIRQFKRNLEARGITLVLMPTPVKPSVQHGQLARAGGPATNAALHNASYDAFIGDIQRDGVLVFDPSAEIARSSADGTAQYLVTDTHWRPETMQRVAEALAAFLQRHAALPSVPSPGYEAERREARNLGDTAAMLDLPPDQTLYPAERVTLRFVVDRAGDPWRPSREADILLLGDSFTNMYSLATMGWGEAAGLAEQLSYTLQRPVDRIVQNDEGAHATRGLLRRDVGAANDRLAGKRVVIWQFAARELAFGDWRVIDIPAAP